jgi:hypothetical protein
MCLCIDEKWHPKFKARVATQDILVYKVLERLEDGHEDGRRTFSYYAPYRTGFEWKLEQRHTATMEKRGTFRVTVHAGLHSCRTSQAAQNRLCHMGKILPAIIPKGSRLYYGENGDIVSNALIIYPNRKALIKARGEIGLAIERHKIAI